MKLPSGMHNWPGAAFLAGGWCDGLDCVFHMRFLPAQEGQVETWNDEQDVGMTIILNLYRISTFTLILKSLFFIFVCYLHSSIRFFKCTSQVKKVSALILFVV